MKNRLKLIETTTVCCVCGQHISGPWPASRDLSHGYCKLHHRLAMREIKKYFTLLDRQPTSSFHAQAA